MHLRWRTQIIISLSFLLSSCTDDSRQVSGGKPYEVLVVNDSHDSLRHILSVETPDLPQSEPQFDVSSLKQDRLQDGTKMAHSIVIHQAKGTYRIQRNLYAQPQIVIHASAGDSLQLRKDLKRFELYCEAKRLQTYHNPKMERLVKQTFGINILLPVDMNSSMKKKDFLWLSNNSAAGMKNVVICRGNIDKMLANYLKGETDDMYMKRITPCKNSGLWEMKGDAMGGPYRMRQIKDGKQRDLTILTFVYAPSMKKRNLIQQLEAVLYTINYGRK